MEKLSSEVLLYILIGGGILLFNFLTQRAAARRQQEEAERAAAGPAEELAPDEPLPELWGRTQPAPAARQTEPPVPDEPLPEFWGRTQPAPAAVVLSAAPALPLRASAAPSVTAESRRRASARSLLRGARSLQQAMVVMTVLGPCRAMDPPDGVGRRQGN